MHRRKSQESPLGGIVIVLLLLCIATSGAQNPDWKTLTSNGSQAFHEGRYVEAMQLFKAALTVAEALPPHDPRLATSLMHLANAYRVQEQYALAAPLYERALRLREQALGRSHPQVADVLEAYADLLRQQHPWQSSFPWSAAAKMAARARRIRQLGGADRNRPDQPEPPDQWRWPQDEKEIFGDSNA
jgi:tetratricopeptide (TPR) repeat protein